NDAASREAHRRLSERLARDEAAWAVLSMDGLLLAAEVPRPLETLPDQGQSAIADWTRQVRQLERELQTAQAARHATSAEVQTAPYSLDDAEADDRSARLTASETEARLAALRRVESTQRAEAHELAGARDRADRAAGQRQEERKRAATRA